MNTNGRKVVSLVSARQQEQLLSFVEDLKTTLHEVAERYGLDPKVFRAQLLGLSIGQMMAEGLTPEQILEVTRLVIDAIASQRGRLESGDPVEERKALAEMCDTNREIQHHLKKDAP